MRMRKGKCKDKNSGLGSAFRMIKRYLAYQAEQPFAAIFGTESFSSNRVDLKNTLCALTSALASVRESRKAKRIGNIRLKSECLRHFKGMRSNNNLISFFFNALAMIFKYWIRSHTHAKII